MLAELENEPRAAISELELAHLYSPTNSWITQELILRLLRDEANIGRAREIIDTALLYAPESPGLTGFMCFSKSDTARFTPDSSLLFGA